MEKTLTDARFSVGVFGATSPAGTQALNLLVERGFDVVAFSRSRPDAISKHVRWVNLVSPNPTLLARETGAIATWVVFSPIWVLEGYFPLMIRLGANRVVCVSSTSRFTKMGSSSSYEDQLAQKLIRGERALIDWAQREGISWTILRPTLIYGRGTDKNISEIARIVRKFRFFPLFGQANGLRQPIYVDDVATACVQAAFSSAAIDKAYNISGAEQLTYKEMVSRVFVAVNCPPRFIRVNLKLFRCALFFLKKMPRYKNWNAEMVLRVNRDMVFDHDEASRDFSFNPQRFILHAMDV